MVRYFEMYEEMSNFLKSDSITDKNTGTVSGFNTTCVILHKYWTRALIIQALKYVIPLIPSLQHISAICVNDLEKDYFWEKP